jgi:hypothetical protein
MSHWTTRYKNRLSDDAFLLIAKGGRKDATGRTKPRDLRHLPVKSHLGKVDLPHVRAAIARAPRVKGVSAEVKKAAQAKARKILAVEKAVREELAMRRLERSRA